MIIQYFIGPPLYQSKQTWDPTRFSAPSRCQLVRLAKPPTQANTQQLRAHLLPLTESDHHPNFHTGALFRRPTSMPQAGTSGGGLSIIPFLVSLSGLTSGTLLPLQSVLTVMPHVRIYYTTFFSAQQREIYMDRLTARLHKTSSPGQTTNWKVSSSHPVLASRLLSGNTESMSIS